MTTINQTETITNLIAKKSTRNILVYYCQLWLREVISILLYDNKKLF